MVRRKISGAARYFFAFEAKALLQFSRIYDMMS